MKSLGICLGASTVSAVVLEKNEKGITVLDYKRASHEGNPKGTLKKLLESNVWQVDHVAVTGRKFRHILKMPSITEPEAVEVALGYVWKDKKLPEAVISAGGETFMVYLLDTEGKIHNVTTGNKCASGTGEFFLQQIKRMDLTIEDAIEKGKQGKAYSVSGRCSVFCKSDCTHALNKGVPITDITAGLCKMISSKIHELLLKEKIKNIMVIGGTSKNEVVMDYLRAEVDTLIIPEEAAYFEALGTALWGFDNKDTVPAKWDEIFEEFTTSFNFLPSFKSSQDKVVFKEASRISLNEGDECVVGLDVGSTTTKAVVVRTKDHGIAASIYLRTNGDPIQASRNCYKALLEQIGDIKINVIGLGTTGSGRQIAGLHALTDGIINEIIAHARAASFYDPEVDTIFEIGGQDAKYTYLTNSVPSDYAMNEACSAGTGSFLEEAAFESLSVDVKDIGDIAMQAEEIPNFSDQCAAFISSDIKTAFQEGVSRESVIAGLVHSICLNYDNRVKGHRPVGKKVFMQGGVCYNKAVPIAMAALIGKNIIVPPDPGLMGAFGVALEVQAQIELGFLEKGFFDLTILKDRIVEYKDSFTCGGGREKCDRACSINRIKIEDQIYPFGGACNMYYNLRHKINVSSKKFDLIEYRNHLYFNKYAPVQENLASDAPSVGINKTFHQHSVFPLFYHYFNQLGVKIHLSDRVCDEGVDRKETSFCFPCELALGLFHDLLEKKPDYIFMPHLEEMYVNDKENPRKEFHCTCIFIQGEAFFLMEGFKDRKTEFKSKMISPTLNFSKGFESEQDVFGKMAQKFGKTYEEGIAAFKFGIMQQKAFWKECKEACNEVLKEIEKDKEKIGIVIIGRPYNSFAKEANKGIPYKYASRGIYVIPHDMLPWEEIEDDPDMFWEMGHRLMKATKFVKQHPQLFATYIMNFLCAIDSILITYFRDIMGVKPSLTLELDGHTADAGINTRIEAFLDIIRNYKKMSADLKDIDYSEYKPSHMEKIGSDLYMINSRKEKYAITDPRVKLILPNMGDATTRLLAAAFVSCGINAEPLPVPDMQVLKYGRANTTCKECLPMLLCIGSFLKYLLHARPKGENIILFVPAAAGYCRLGQYRIFIRDMLKKLNIRDVSILSLENESSYAGLGANFKLAAWKAVVMGDVLKDINNSIRAMAQDPEAGQKIYDEELDRIVGIVKNKGKHLYRTLSNSARRFAKISRKFELLEANFVAIVGEIFVRRDRFSRQGLIGRLAKDGFVVRVAHLSEWMYYMDYMIKHGMFQTNHTWREKMEMKISNMFQQHIEKKLKRIFIKSGLLEISYVDLDKTIAHSTHILPRELKGEPGMIIGMALDESAHKYAGIINIGPFGCMPVRYIESTLTPSMTIGGKKEGLEEAGVELDLSGFKDTDVLPFLTLETDGNPFPQIIEARIETFCLQAKRMGEKIKEEKKFKRLAHTH
ncbi:acyl-CoA dehydratase activase [bacterium]|nr:acyl-CoA dehydratase activase [bacterium]